ncbi:SpoIIE family protein phosphatase [Streptomyces sp. GS7]|uniref:SpoIIE family protein phosphatase n=1 Tax=Streptomyces sp. GS7 TaxID=2692234 RepID=UPI001317EF56|nr:SpoIIE family protein phosphatase [Streptomyces sp. GS7]QHC26313.1 SpoIIE family protein phosphatase [Streptomyces sp. GS7]
MTSETDRPERPGDGAGGRVGDGGDRAAWDITMAAVAELDARGTVVAWTRAAERLLGYPAGEVLGHGALELLAVAGDAERAAAVARWCRAGDGWSGSVAVRHRDGRAVQLAVQVSRVAGIAEAGTEGAGTADDGEPDDGAGRGGERWAVLALEEWRVPGGGVNQLMLEPFLAQAPVGMAVLDTELRYVWVNDVLERLIPLERRLGRTVGEVLPPEEAAAFDERMKRVLATGVPVMDYEFRSPTYADPTQERAYSASFFRLAGPHRRKAGIWYMVIDVTERWRAQERLALLNDASARIGSTLDVTRTAQELADVAVPALADFAAVDLLDSVLRGEEPVPGPVDSTPTMRRSGQRSVREGCPEAGPAVGEVVRRAPSSAVARCLLSGEPVVESQLAAGSSWMTEDPQRADVVREFGFRSMMVAPVRARGVTLGAATFVRSRRLGPFAADDVRLAEELVARAAVCIDNARRFTRERTAARMMQRSLLPHALAGGSALDVASWYYPADAPSGVGGDWFDVIPLSGARVALVVGDVVGHGIDAAATMGRLRTAVRTLANLDLPPDELLARLDDLVIGLMETRRDGGSAAGEDDGTPATPMGFMGATCLYVVYDPVSRRCTMARAGHLPPAVVAPDGTVAFPDLPAGPPLGLGALPFEPAELELAEGSLLALYTNGLLQTGDRDLGVGMSRLSRALAAPGATLEEVGRNAVAALLTGPPSDDAALLLARTHALGTGQVASWDLPTDPAVVARARALAGRQLSVWGMEPLLFTTELVVSELVTNAIRHGGGPITLRLIRQDAALICEVFDTGSTAPHLRHARTTDEGGRGLLIVAQLTRRWGTRFTANGKIIWAEQGHRDALKDAAAVVL